MTVAPGPLDQPTLHEALVDRLRTLIVEAGLEAGETVHEQALSDRVDVSRTPLREGLVVQTPRRGATVAGIRRSDLEEVFPVLASLEATAGELAAHNVTDPGIQRARVLQARLATRHRAGDLDRYTATNAAIHALIADAARNPTLARLLAGLEGRVRCARHRANLSPVALGGGGCRARRDPRRARRPGRRPPRFAAQAPHHGQARGPVLTWLADDG